MENKDFTISIVGNGNVGFHLSNALHIPAINPHTLEGLPPHSGIIIMAVKDDAISDVAKCLEGKCDILCHTSGSVPLSVLDGYAPHTGVIYPLQTFTKNVPLDYSNIPFFTEASDNETENIITGVAKSVSGNVSHADSDGRKRLHIGAVLACNFSNHLIALADRFLNETGMDYRMLLPLLHQTIDKLDTVSPTEAQTGPAARKDLEVIRMHLAILESNPGLQNIYRILSESIMNSISNTTT